MKKILFTISILLALFATSCSNEEMDVTLTDNEMVELTFSVNIPELAVASRAFDGSQYVSNVTSLQLLAFYENGVMFACPTAILDEANKGGDVTEGKYKVKLP